MLTEVEADSEGVLRTVKDGMDEETSTGTEL